MSAVRNAQKDDTFLAIAETLARLGTCDRAQVGALIVKDGRCVSWGYNGAPPGSPHCAENWHGYEDPNHPGWFKGPLPVGCEHHTSPEQRDAALEAYGCRNATHAEANAVAFAARQGISTDWGTLYATITPCRICSMTLVAAGIVRVVAARRYYRDSGLDVLIQAGIEVTHAEDTP